VKSPLISIKPKWCELIANGSKTIEVRKTKPHIDVPFKCYVYCTKGEETYGMVGGKSN
jgi:predicted transcriptional regulator